MTENYQIMTPAFTEVATERMRQIRVEGFTPSDDVTKNSLGDLASAAVAYIDHFIFYASDVLNKKISSEDFQNTDFGPPESWPKNFEASMWKPKSPRRDLVRAAALIIAEIDRLDNEHTSHG